MKPISSILADKEIRKVKSKHTEYSDLQDYFFTLNLTDKLGKKLSRGAIGFLLIPFISGERGDRNYSLLYTLKDKCEKSDCPQAVAWSYLRNRR